MLQRLLRPVSTHADTDEQPASSLTQRPKSHHKRRQQHGVAGTKELHPLVRTMAEDFHAPRAEDLDQLHQLQKSAKRPQGMLPVSFCACNSS